MSTGLMRNMSITYRYVFDEMADPRVSDWWLMDRPWTLLIILSCYLYFALVWGPRFMRSRKPFDLRPAIVVYNVIQIAGSFLVSISLLSVSWRMKITLGCELVDYSSKPDSVWLLSLFWYGMILRLIDLTETVFFVLRKKFAQASFLHLYHHTVALLLIWLTTKYLGGGMCVFPLMLNSLTHTAMYTYYLLSSVRALALTESVLRWKRRLTKLQMVQFVVLIIHSLNTLRVDCSVPLTMAVLHVLNLFMNLYLFHSFYRRAYKPAVKCATQ